MFRMPLRAYRHDAGWLLGHTFLEFAHIGRKTGRRYETVAHGAAVRPGRPRGRHLRRLGPGHRLGAQPARRSAARVRLGRESFTPQHRFLSEEEAFERRRPVPPRAPAAATAAQHDPGLGRPAGRRRRPRLHPYPPVRRVPPGDDQPGLTSGRALGPPAADGEQLADRPPLGWTTPCRRLRPSAPREASSPAPPGEARRPGSAAIPWWRCMPPSLSPAGGSPTRCAAGS